LNPPGGQCPFTGVTSTGTNCTTGFFDDRGYKTKNGTTIGTVGAVLPGSGPPPAPVFNTLTGFDTSSTTIRKFGDGTGAGFGDKKGLDLWTYFPATPV